MKILVFLLVLVFVPVFFVGSFLYMLIFKVLSETPVPPGGSPFDMYPVIMKTNFAVAVGFMPLFLLLFIWGVIISHRITGPTTRLKREIDRMAETGDFKARLGVRKHDYIKPLVNSINKLLDKVCEKQAS